MKSLGLRSYGRLICLLVLWVVILSPTSAADSPAPRLTPADVISVVERVADWQLAHPSAHPSTHWTEAAKDAGMMAPAGISGSSKYRDALNAMGEANDWTPTMQIL